MFYLNVHKTGTPSSSQLSLVQASMLASPISSSGGRAEVHLRGSPSLSRVSWTSQNHPVSSGTDPHPHHIRLK